MPLALMAAALRQPLDQWPANRGGRWYFCQRCLDTSHMRLEIRRRDAQRWRAPELRRHLLTIVDADGSARRDTSSTGLDTAPPLQDASVLPTMPAPNSSTILMESLIERASAGERLHESTIVQLFSARGGNVDHRACIARIPLGANLLVMAAVGDTLCMPRPSSLGKADRTARSKRRPSRH